ncbi:MAG: FMN-binding protein, partial [Pseudomonadales bacterium]|nr:FMN-binding protein [Pseudomonadales bacterium]NIX09254.1 FMN-binding protein [Pseudomonadales bacterium]
MPRESIARTLAIAVAVALACSVMVSGAVYLLRPIQIAYDLVDRNRAIVAAAGVEGVPEDAGDAAVVRAFLDLDALLLDLDSGEFLDTADAHGYDHWAGVTDDASVVPVYVSRKDGEAVRLVLPVHGRGMWSTIYGYLAMEADLTTIAALVIHRHGETPGVGDRIQDPAWQAQWRGKRAFGPDGAVVIDVARGGNGQQPGRVDAITGATVTS